MTDYTKEGKGERNILDGDEYEECQGIQNCIACADEFWKEDTGAKHTCGEANNG